MGRDCAVETWMLKQLLLCFCELVYDHGFIYFMHIIMYKTFLSS